MSSLHKQSEHGPVIHPLCSVGNRRTDSPLIKPEASFRRFTRALQQWLPCIQEAILPNPEYLFFFPAGAGFCIETAPQQWEGPDWLQWVGEYDRWSCLSNLTNRAKYAMAVKHIIATAACIGPSPTASYLLGCQENRSSTSCFCCPLTVCVNKDLSH